MYFAYGYGLYFYLTWLPTYLVTELGFSALGGGFFASLPFLLAGIADVTGGWLTDRLARRHSLRVARCGVGFTAFATTAALLFASTLDAGADGEGAAAGAGARLGRSVAERLLGGAARRRGGSRRRHHRVHEHVRQSRRAAVSTGRRVGGRAAAFVDAALLHHRRRIQSLAPLAWLAIDPEQRILAAPAPAPTGSVRPVPQQCSVP